MKKLVFLSALAVILLVLASAWGCAREEQKPKKEVLAQVDGEDITAGDLAAFDSSLDIGGRRLVGSAKEADRLDLVIERKAMLHRAMKLNLHKDPDFVKAIQKYWEYALLSKMLEKKKKEIEGEVNITDQELDGYTKKACYRFRYRSNSFGSMSEAEAFAGLCRSGRSTAPGDEVSVAGCEGMSPAFADEIFRLNPGEVKVIKKGGEFVVVKMLAKDKDFVTGSMPQSEEVRKYALEMKRAEALDDWVASVIKGAKVERYDNKKVAK